MSIYTKEKEIYQVLQKYIEKKSEYNPIVLTKTVDNTYPLVVFETNSNTSNLITQDMYRLDRVRNLSFEISIVAINKGTISSEAICDELADLVCDVMQDYYRMQGGLDAKLKNINTAKATKYVLHFSCKWNVRQNIIY